MSELSKLIPQAIIVEVKGLQFKVKPPCLKHVALFEEAREAANSKDSKKQFEIMAKIVEIVVKDSFPEATEEEINAIPIDTLVELTEKIMEVYNKSMPVPKKKHSKSRSGRRRGKIKFTLPTLTKCSNCKKRKFPHRICPHCNEIR